MKSKGFFTTMAAAVIAAGFMINGCSDKEKTQPGGISSTDATDSISSRLIAQIEEQRLAREEALFASNESASANDGLYAFDDMLLVDSNVYAVCGNELIVYNLSTKSEQRIATGGSLHAVTAHAGKIYVGGDKLYLFADGVLEALPIKIAGTIASLTSHDIYLMIGTTEGLYARSIFGDIALFDGIDVTAMTSDNDGLWVGTNGDGLYRWDGNEFKRRFLHRDTAVFDMVNALDFSHNHLFVGTDDALYVYNGGRWTTVTTESGLLSNTVNGIDASGWVVYIATDGGVVSWFNYDVLPVEKFEGIVAADVRVIGNKILVATEGNGLLLKAGPVVTTLIEPQADVFEAAQLPTEPQADLSAEPQTDLSAEPQTVPTVEPAAIEPVAVDPVSVEPVEVNPVEVEPVAVYDTTE